MKKKNKILFLLHLPPPVHGSSIVGKLIKESETVNRSFQTRYFNLLMSRSVKESGKKSASKLIRFIFSWFQLLFELITEKPDLCYFALTTRGSAFYKDVSLVFLLQLFKVKTVFHLHNKGVKKNSTKKINYLLYRYVFRKSSVILLSKYLYNDIEMFVLEEQLYFCPNGVQVISTQAISKSEKPNSPIRILFLSNLIKSKGVFTLIEACEILRRKGYKFFCDFVGGEGDVSANQFKEEVEKRGLVETVEYLGKRYGEDKNIVYISADIFVLPTSNDCFPLVLLEAMQYELPIISTYEGGIQDIVENEVTGLLVNKKNAVDLADKLEILMNNRSLRLKMGKAGRAKYEKEFTLHTFETKLQEILQHLLFNS